MADLATMPVTVMIGVKVRTTFEAAHRLPNYDGDCYRMHGHRYAVTLELVSKPDAIPTQAQPSGMLVDMKLVRHLMNQHIIRHTDHAVLNDFIINPTAERIAEWIYGRIAPALACNPETQHIHVGSVEVEETDGCSAILYAIMEPDADLEGSIDG